MHQRERHPRYMGSFGDFWVGIPGSTGDMKLIFICLDLLIHFALLLCFCYFFLAIAPIFRLPDAMRTTGCAKSLPNYYFFFSTRRSIFRTLALFLAAKFLFLELHHTGPVVCFV